MKKIALALLVLGLYACGGGGSDGEDLSTDACGVLGLPTKNAKIVNGTACNSLDDSPVVRIVVLDSAGEPLGLCTGTMITSNDVLTAAHCVVNGTSGAAIIYGDSGSTKSVRVSSITQHPEYRPVAQVGDTFAAFNDIAIFSLASPINLPTLPILSSSYVASGEEISIFGYGTDENGTLDFTDLKSGEMAVDSVSDNHISTFFTGSGSNTCQGDSGGPAVTQRTGVAAIAGVTSTGTAQGCGTGDNSLFINMGSTKALDFVLSLVPDAGLI